MIGLIYLTGFALYFLIGLVFSIFYFKRSKRKHRWIVFIVFISVYLPFPWADMFFKSAVITARTFNTDLQEIRQTVESPESVLWIDNVWPGYDEYGRHWMVQSYLDGIHLKTLVLNGDDGKFYLYRASEKDFSESEKLRPKHERLMREKRELEKEARRIGRSGDRKKADELWKLIREEYPPKIKAVGYERKRREEFAAWGEVFNKADDLPSVRYRVEFNPIPITWLEKKLLWADEIKIISNRNNEVIAYSKRYMGYISWLDFFSSGGPFAGGFQRGDVWAYEFDNKVLFGYSLKNDECHSSFFHNRRD